MCRQGIFNRGKVPQEQLKIHWPSVDFEMVTVLVKTRGMLDSSWIKCLGHTADIPEPMYFPTPGAGGRGGRNGCSLDMKFLTLVAIRRGHCDVVIAFGCNPLFNSILCLVADDLL